MRALVVLALLGGCAGPTRPAVLPMLSELPGDPQKRDAVLDSAGAQPGPEQRKPLPPKLHKAETAAATAAAVIGGLFSKTQNVTLGAALFAPPPPPARKREASKHNDGDEEPAAPPELIDRPVNLVPWVPLK